MADQKAEQKTSKETEETVLAHSFTEFPETAQALVLSFFQPAELARVKQIGDLSSSNNVVETYLKKTKEIRQSTRPYSEIYQNSPEDRLPAYYPHLEEKPAAAFYRKVLKKYPDDLPAKFGLAFLIAMGETNQLPTDVAIQEAKSSYQPGVQTLLQELAQHPTNTDCLYYLGRLLQANRLGPNAANILQLTSEQSQQKAVAQIFGKVLGIDPLNQKALFRVGLMLENDEETGLPEGKEDCLSKYEKAAEFYRKVIARKLPHFHALFRLAELMRAGEIDAKKEDFPGAATQSTGLEKYKAYIQYIANQAPESEYVVKGREKIATEEAQKQRLLQIPNDKWSPFIYQHFIVGFEELSRKQQYALLNIVKRAPPVTLNPRYHAEINKAGAKNTLLAMVGALGMLIVGASALTATGLDPAGWRAHAIDETTFLSIIGVELFLTFFLPFVVGGYLHFTEPLVKKAEISLQQDHLVEQITLALENFGQASSFFPQLNNQQELEVFLYLAQTPAEKWPADLKRSRCLEDFNNNPAQRARIITAVQEINSQNFSNDLAVKRAKILEIVVPIILGCCLTLAPAAYGIAQTLEQINNDQIISIVAIEAVAAIVVAMLVSYLIYALVGSSWSNYVESSVRDNAMVEAVTGVVRSAHLEIPDEKTPLVSPMPS